MKLRLNRCELSLACLLVLGAAHPQAFAAITCASVTATNATGITPASGNLDISGSITVTCTRLAGDPTTQVIYIGINTGENPDGTAGREFTRQSGTQQMNYAIFRNSTPSGAWSEGNGRAPGSTLGGGLQVTVTFTSAGTTSQSFTYPYYIRVTQANYSGAGQPPGIYDDSPLVRVRLNDRNGPIQATAIFTPVVSKPSHCYFSLPPSTLNMNYTAFSTTAQTGSTSFGVSCTATTTYTMALSATSGVLLGLNYTLALSATGTQTGNGFQQSYNVTGNIAAGQAGTCATGSCTGTQARTITITY
jgi:spore coat protein U-like protein